MSLGIDTYEEGTTYKVLRTFVLEVMARIRPRLSYVCHIRPTDLIYFPMDVVET